MSRVSFLWGVLCLLSVSAFAQQPENTKAVEKTSDSIVELSSGEVPALPDLRLRRNVMLRQLVGPQAILEVFPGTLSDEARNFPNAWGRGPAGLGKRFANQYGQFVFSELIEFGVS